MFLKAYLAGYTAMALTSNDLDRLKYAPQRVEDGEVFDFNNKSMFGKVEGIEDQVILDAARVNEATRFTAALKRDYQEGMDKFIASLIGGDAPAEDEEEAKADPVQELYTKLYEIAAAGDKRTFKSLRKELKDQWFALDDADVEDAIFDLGDAVADKDVDYAKEIVEGLGEDQEDAPEEETPKKSEKSTKLTDEESEIIEDIKSAIDDGDEKDFNELIDELKEINPDLADEWSTAFTAQDAPEEETKEEEEYDNAQDSESSVVDEIIEDLDAAIADGDEEEAKACLEELADEVGVDSDTYKVNAEKLAPKKTRRSRRGK